MRFKEAGVLHSLRIVGSRLTGYALWPRATLSKWCGRHLGPTQFGATGSRQRVQDDSFLVVWGREDLATIVEVLGHQDAALGEALVRRADALLSDGAQLLGWGRASLVVPVQWHADETSATTWPAVFHKFIDTAREGEPCDVKYPWELSRLQFLPVLAATWLQTGDSRYGKATWDLVIDWSAQNPEGFGVNWTCSMEVAIRAINIALTLNIIQAVLTVEQLRFARRLLRAHERHLRWNLEISDVSGNHLYFDYLGIAWLSLTLDGASSARFRRDRRRLADETDRQFHADGIHIEHATGYQRLMLEGVVLFQIACGRHGTEPNSTLESVAKRALPYLEAICDADGALPAVGDSDSGNVLTMGGIAGNHAAHLFELYAAAGMEGPASHRRMDRVTALWFSREARAAWFNQTAAPPDASTLRALSFDDSGYYVIRGGGLVLVLRAGPSGLRGRGSHDHNDQLSLVLSLDGCPVFIDGGTCTYTANLAQHAWDLATAHHNTVAVDDVEQSPIVRGSVTCTVRNAPGHGRFIDSDLPGRVVWQGTVPYGALGNTPLKHTRSLSVFAPAPGVFDIEIRDGIAGSSSGALSASANFLLHPDCTVTLDKANTGARIARGEQQVARIAVDRGGPASLRPDTAALEYGRNRETCRVVIPLTAALEAVVRLRLERVDARTGKDSAVCAPAAEAD